MYRSKTTALDECWGPTHKVTFVADETEQTDWRAREAGRFASGLYAPVPWAELDKYPDHFAHLSIKTPGLIAYTADEERGQTDRQTKIRPGKYLSRFYPEFQPEQVKDYVRLCASEYLELKLARTPDEIEEVYVHGPDSCMGHDEREFESDFHPVRVYGDSDLAVAYLGSIEEREISARCICWPDKQIFYRGYGNEDLLAQVLTDHGYRAGSSSDFNGARIRAVRDSGGRYIMPFIDMCESVGLDDTKQWFILGQGPIGCRETDGRSCGGAYTCANCGDVDVDDEGDYCDTCGGNLWSCYNCGNNFFDDDCRYTAEASDRDYCSHCWENTEKVCDVDGCDNTWHEDDAFDYYAREDRIRRRMNHTCPDCYETHIRCHCGNYLELHEGVAEVCSCQPTPVQTSEEITA
jgi:hypothetical protein